MSSLVAEPNRAKRGASRSEPGAATVYSPLARAYFAIKFRPDYRDREWINEISESLLSVGIETSVMVRDHEMWGENRLSPHELMQRTFEEINVADFIIIEFSEKGVGLGIEAGYAFAVCKPIIVVAKYGSEISTTLQGIAQHVIFYVDTCSIGRLIVNTLQR